MKKLFLSAAGVLFAACAAQVFGAGCGSDEDAGVAITGDNDGSADDGNPANTTDGAAGDAAPGDALACKAEKEACGADTECCSGNCSALEDGGPKTCGFAALRHLPRGSDDRRARVD